MQGEVNLALQSIRKNRGKALNGQWVAGTPDWLQKYAAEVVQLGVKEEGLTFSAEAMAQCRPGPSTVEVRLLLLLWIACRSHRLCRVHSVLHIYYSAHHS